MGLYHHVKKMQYLYGGLESPWFEPSLNEDHVTLALKDSMSAVAKQMAKNIDDAILAMAMTGSTASEAALSVEKLAEAMRAVSRPQRENPMDAYDAPRKIVLE